MSIIVEGAYQQFYLSMQRWNQGSHYLRTIIGLWLIMMMTKMIATVIIMIFFSLALDEGRPADGARRFKPGRYRL